MALELSDDSRKFIEGILRSKDKNGNGVIDKRELGACLTALGLNTTADHLDFLMAHFDKNGDGTLQIAELMENLDVINVHSIKGGEMMDAFKKFDVNGDGYIGVREMTAILTVGPDALSKDEAKALITELLQEYDTDRNGKFSYGEFVRLTMEDNCLTKS